MTKETIAIIGATGLVGRTLYDIVDKTRCEIAVVGRSVDKLRSVFPSEINHMDWDGLKDSEATDYAVIVNLAGSGVTGLFDEAKHKASLRGIPEWVVEPPTGDPHELLAFMEAHGLTHEHLINSTVKRKRKAA